jgi:hypothetical protein
MTHELSSQMNPGREDAETINSILAITYGFMGFQALFTALEPVKDSI